MVEKNHVFLAANYISKSIAIYLIHYTSYSILNRAANSAARDILLDIIFCRIYD